VAIQGSPHPARQVEQLLRDQALILAEHEGTVVGSVNVNLLQDGVAEFGMLVADPARRSMGIGTALVQAAEDWARRRKCHTMRLELLTPRGWTHPSKEFLREWYERSHETGSARPRIVGRGPTQ
jgi:GNAT superfamily N-acetyltransferase